MFRPSLFFAFAALANTLFATDYYVAKNGLDTNPGTLTQPRKTIQKAADQLLAGDRLFVRKGVYKELVTINVSGASGSPITLTNYPNEKPVIDASGIAPPPDGGALIFIQDQSWLVISGFELRNFSTAKADLQPSGIFITGAAHDIALRNNNVHAIRNTNRNGNAFGIAIYGTSTAQPITNLILDGNEVHHLKTGFSESFTLNGNVTNFHVTNNRIHDNNNIGLDFIGFEGTCPDPAQDRARDGECSGNIVWNISSRSNPSYRGSVSADGIYCDGAERVTIERNVISLADYGAELASEHADGNCTDCVFRDNFIYHCRAAGLGLGGYDAQRGSTVNCTVTNNTFYQNDTLRTGGGEILLQFYLTGNTIKQNIFVAGRQSILVSNPATSNDGTVFDYNCYFAPAGVADSEWDWKNATSNGFDAWKTASGQDAHSLFADPQFVNVKKYDLHLQTGSPAIDAGNPAFTAATGELDIDSGPRVTGAHVDIGADEQAP